MSLIQEALRRQQEEQEAEKKGGGTTLDTTSEAPDAIPDPQESDVPPASEPAIWEEPVPQRKLGLQSRVTVPQDEPADELPPEPPPVRVTPAEKEHRVLVPLLGVLLLLALLGGIVAWSLLYGVRIFSKTDERVEPVMVETVTPTPPAPPAESPPVVEIADTPVVDGDTADATDITDPGTEPTTTAVLPETPATDPAPQEVSTSLSPTRTPAPPQEPAPPAVPVIWPEVVVSGVIGAGNSGSAIINSKVIGLNESIDNMTLREVGRGFVVLEYQADTRQFSVGRPIR